MDKSRDEFKILTPTCWIEKYQPLIIDKTKDNYAGRYRFEVDSLFVLKANPFYYPMRAFLILSRPVFRSN